jgi:hypothetical protein
VVASVAANRADRAVLTDRVEVANSGWLAARVASAEHIRSGFPTSMGAHSSPIYLDVDGRRPHSPVDAAAIGTIIDGARTWVETLATVRSPAERARLAHYFASRLAALDEVTAAAAGR